MVEPNRFIEETPGKTTVVTFLTDGFEDVEAMGFGVKGGEERAILEALEGEIQPMLDIPEDVQLEQQELELPPEVPAGDGEVQGEIVVGEVLPHQIEVDGNVLTGASSLATLRAACGFYGVSRSGSKAKCHRRLCQHQKTLELLSAQAEIAQTQGVVERHPNAQTLVKPPDPKLRNDRSCTS